ncbi:Helicase ATP-binding domain-containing protein [Mycena sanguinolenta]|uniref:Helicase ATP-binding domain-containing protein n=1 Tax=Mycena sanguinolenta TaxID=230812 RepID=A0A8H6XEA4_9AGAR|nr:Helicase ATP-binding domain-containing protein [Mycena sanguinolenta]
MSYPRLDEVERVAQATVAALSSAGIQSCLVGGMACSIYGNSRVPSDVDIVCLTDTLTQEALKAILVSADSSFYTVASKDPFATYRVLWYRLGYHRSCKVDVLQPGIMNIPAVPIPRIAYRKSCSDLPLMPFLPLLLLKLQAWMDHRAEAKLYLRQKQHVDVRDIGELLELAVEKYDVNIKQDTKWLPESFLKAAVARVKAYVKCFPDSAEHWRDIGFRV